MDSLQINSSHSLTMSMTDKRPAEPHSYEINCRQFGPAYKTWQKTGAARGQPLGIMTVGFERIWITGVEGEQVAAAIASGRPSLELD